MHELIAFYTDIASHNDRNWFAANKARYKRCEATFNALVAELINEIAAFDESVAGLTPRDCVYRIYRDTRFSLDKSPYKTWISAFIAPHGKKSGYAGYYLHIEPSNKGLIGGNLLAAGAHLPQPVDLRSIREEIVDNGAGIRRAIADAKDFTLDADYALTRNPKDFPTCEFDDLLRLKDHIISRSLTADDLLAPDLVKRIAAEFRKAAPYVKILNRAIQYAREEMM